MEVNVQLRLGSWYHQWEEILNYLGPGLEAEVYLSSGSEIKYELLMQMNNDFEKWNNPDARTCGRIIHSSIMKIFKNILIWNHGVKLQPQAYHKHHSLTKSNCWNKNYVQSQIRYFWKLWEANKFLICLSSVISSAQLPSMHQNSLCGCSIIFHLQKFNTILHFQRSSFRTSTSYTDWC